MLFTNRVGSVLLLGMSLLSVGCQESRNEKKVFPIGGTVMVDGVAAEGVQVVLHESGGVDKSQPTVTQGTTDAQGKVRLSTYADGDGAPKGEYKVTYSWQEFNILSRSYSGQDKLNKKYADPANSAFTLSVGDGQKNDLGTVELTSKK